MTSRGLGIDDLYRLRTAGSPSIDPDGRRVAFTVSTADRERDRWVTHIWTVEEGDEARRLTRGENGDTSPRWSPDGRRLAFLSARGEGARQQLWMLEPGGGDPWPVTDVKGGVIAFRWSPDGSRIAFLSTVEPDPEHEDGSPIVVRRLHYKADGPGMLRDGRTHLFVVTPPTGQVVQLTNGDFFAASPAWSPDGTTLAFTAALHDDRDLDMASHLFTIDAGGGGEMRQVTSGPGLASAPLWSGDGRALVFAGRARATDLQWTLHSVDARGGEPADLLVGFDRNVMVGGPGYPGAAPALTPDGAAVVFCARIGGCTHAFRLPLHGGAPQPLLAHPEMVVKGLDVSSGAAIGAAVAGLPDTPGDVLRVDLVTGATARLTELNRDLLAEAAPLLAERRTFTAPDGLEIEGWLWRDPAAATPAPLLLDIHGGPHNAWTPGLDADHLFHDELVARGWSVLTLNPRGSDGYGLAFMSGVHAGWGENDQRDFLAAVDALVAEGIADPERLAVTGYSYGGFMTTWLVGHTDRFRAAVAGGVATDLLSIIGTMDVGAAMARSEFGADPLDDRALYERLSPLSYAGRITTPILILHGQADERCPAGQAEELFAALRRRRREVEMVLYPGAGHLFIIQGRPSHKADYARRVVDWVTARIDDDQAGRPPHLALSNPTSDAAPGAS
jgi:dipeptidyl aminopeptidase/acylaminoacyl peptidase